MDGRVEKAQKWWRRNEEEIGGGAVTVALIRHLLVSRCVVVHHQHNIRGKRGQWPHPQAGGQLEISKTHLRRTPKCKYSGSPSFHTHSNGVAMSICSRWSAAPLVLSTPRRESRWLAAPSVLSTQRRESRWSAAPLVLSTQRQEYLRIEKVVKRLRVGHAECVLALLRELQDAQ